MSLPRPIFPGELYLITRRVARRRFLLKPSHKLNRAIEYIVAVVAKRTSVRVHALCVLSNHWHAVASDPEGNMPAFLRDVHALIAKCVNSSLGRWENLWSSAQTSLVRASGDTDVLERIVYTMANPVSAHLVAHGASWPGLRLCWPAPRSAVKRPRGFFRENGPMPETAMLELTRPPGFNELDDAELADHLAAAIEAREHETRQRARKKGRRFLGRRAVRKQSAQAAPRNAEPRRKLSPRVAAKNKWRRVEALQRVRDFVRAYRRSYSLWRAGFPDIEFPAGTYLLRVQAGVACASG